MLQAADWRLHVEENHALRIWHLHFDLLTHQANTTHQMHGSSVEMNEADVAPDLMWPPSLGGNQKIKSKPNNCDSSLLLCMRLVRTSRETYFGKQSGNTFLQRWCLCAYPNGPLMSLLKCSYWVPTVHQALCCVCLMSKTCYSILVEEMISFKKKLMGCLGGSVSEVFAFGSGHDLRILGWSPKSSSLLSGESAFLSPYVTSLTCSAFSLFLK